jgi:[acyl-carrier-protein] S-malonyltransferase
MKETGEQLKEYLNNFEIQEGDAKLIANTSVEIITKDSLIEELYKQTFGPVRWVETIEKLKELEVEEFYEIGPGKVLNGLIRKIDRNLKVTNIEKVEDLDF